MLRGLGLSGVAVAALAIGLSGCQTKKDGGGGKAVASQGWNETERGNWYNTDQGSRLIPMAWFEALEQPTDPKAAAPADPKAPVRNFNDQAYLSSFGILPPWRPTDKLPIGFTENAIDDSGLRRTNLHWSGADPKTEKVPWLGMTCAACHTARLTYKDQTYTVDGAPSLFDLQRFIVDLDAALHETQASAAPGGDPARWDRFARAVLKEGDNPEARQRLLAALDRLVKWEDDTEALNQTKVSGMYGAGRLDAVGHIYNRTQLFTESKNPAKNVADAPVSYPHLWNITKQSRLQWNGIAETAKVGASGVIPTDFGALGRNTGEVMGVFGEVVIVPPKKTTPLPGLPNGVGSLVGFQSTARVENLGRIEVQLTKLQPLPWPEAFPAAGDVDLKDDKGVKLSKAAVLAAGETLFNAKCLSCHNPKKVPTEVMLTFDQMGETNRTDEWMACNAWSYKGPAGKLEGVPAGYKDGDPLPANPQVAALLTTTVKGAIIRQKGELATLLAENFFGFTPPPKGGPKLGAAAVGLTAKEIRLQTCLLNGSEKIMAYKARPLEGIWATAPYLHNGSVPTLYDLLLPVDKRPQAFVVGTRAYDPVKAGYDTTPTAPGNSFTIDTRLDGNSNKGHDYGVGALTETQRIQLLEYLKSK